MPGQSKKSRGQPCVINARVINAHNSGSCSSHSAIVLLPLPSSAPTSTPSVLGLWQSVGNVTNFSDRRGAKRIVEEATRFSCAPAGSHASTSFPSSMKRCRATFSRLVNAVSTPNTVVGVEARRTLPLTLPFACRKPLCARVCKSFSPRANSSVWPRSPSQM